MIILASIFSMENMDKYPVRNKANIPTVTNSTWQCNKKGKDKISIKVGEKTDENIVFVDNMIVHLENSRDSPEKTIPNNKTT